MSSFNASWEATTVENGKVNTALNLPTVKNFAWQYTE